MGGHVILTGKYIIDMELNALNIKKTTKVGNIKVACNWKVGQLKMQIKFV